jgi:hypothetical protein
VSSRETRETLDIRQAGPRIDDGATPAIVVVGYNRPVELARLLRSLASGRYPDGAEVPLVISLDGGGGAAVRALADHFEWAHGPLRVIAHESQLGLREHVLACGDLSLEYGSVIVLEDDLFVAPAFYDFAAEALNFYADDEKVSGIALYAQDFNEYARLRFVPLDDGSDSYFVQSPCSWGQAWSAAQWSGFREWYDRQVFTEEALSSMPPEVPRAVAGWPDSSWKKYYQHYLVESGCTFVYPRASLSTNFGARGTHWPYATADFQVPLQAPLPRARSWSFAKRSGAHCLYDPHFELEARCLAAMNPQLAEYDFECDFSGARDPARSRAEYWLSCRPCSDPQLGFDLELVPCELNAAWKLPGSFFSLGKRQDFSRLGARRRARLFRHLHKDAGLALYGWLALQALRERLTRR